MKWGGGGLWLWVDIYVGKTCMCVTCGKKNPQFVSVGVYKGSSLRKGIPIVELSYFAHGHCTKPKKKEKDKRCVDTRSPWAMRNDAATQPKDITLEDLGNPYNQHLMIPTALFIRWLIGQHLLAPVHQVADRPASVGPCSSGG